MSELADGTRRSVKPGGANKDTSLVKENKGLLPSAGGPNGEFKSHPTHSFFTCLNADMEIKPNFFRDKFLKARKIKD